jgi:hypothetical protein
MNSYSISMAIDEQAKLYQRGNSLVFVKLKETLT